MFHNILVAVDGSADAEQALTQAIDLAESEHTRLTLITGVQTLPRSPTPDSAARRWHKSRQRPIMAHSVLRRARDHVPDDLPVTTILTDGPIRAALIDQINRGRHDLIVMGSRGRRAVAPPSSAASAITSSITAPRPF